MTDYLTRDELIELTDAKHRRVQEKWLKANGFAFLVSTTGQSEVLRAHRDAKLGMGTPAAQQTEKPDYGFQLWRLQRLDPTELETDAERTRADELV